MITNYLFDTSFYDGKLGVLVQMLCIRLAERANVADLSRSMTLSYCCYG
jgi:hypothetical protein